MTNALSRRAGENVFPSSRSRIYKDHLGFDPEKDNPLAVLYHHEALAAELFVLTQMDPRTASTTPNTKAKWGTLRSGTFMAAFREKFGFDLNASHRKNLEMNPAWRHYVAKLQTQTREAVMEKLRSDALSAYHDYTWSREAARKAGDYKETRVAAADHLDRIGATEKPTEGGQQILVVLRGRNFNEDSLNKQLPESSAEIVVESNDVEVR